MWPDFTMRSAMFNYVTQEYEYIEDGTLSAVENDKARAYIPQSVASLGMYDIYRELGDSPFEAMFKVLKACAGEKS